MWPRVRVPRPLSATAVEAPAPPTSPSPASRPPSQPARSSLDVKLAHVALAVSAGAATEVDMVIDRGAFRLAATDRASDEIRAVKQAAATRTSR